MMVSRTSERQGRVIDRDSSASMERKKAGGLLLMSYIEATDGNRPRRIAARPGRQGRRCASSHAAASTTARARWSAVCCTIRRRCSTTSWRHWLREQGRRHHRRRSRFRAAGRRPAGGTRAGHHDRRRLPLLRHPAAQLHRRRHAGPRAIHPQHGDRRVRPPISRWC